MTDEEFVQLIERYTSGQATEGEKRLVDAFFEGNERKQPEPEAVVTEAMWQHIAAAVESEPMPRARSNSRRSLMAIACCLLVVAILGYFGYQRYTTESRELITKTALPGEKSIVTLADGSKVYLNSGSSISFPRVFDQSTREITLEGEAFFEVVRNPKQPFIVTTGDIVTRVLGTSFNIEAFSHNDIKVSVATGRVQVSQGGKDSPEGSSQTVFLDPSQQVTYQNHHFTLSYVDIEKAMAWKSNTLQFDETPLSSVGVVLSRWYGVTIAFDNADIVNCRINGQFKGQQLEEVLRSIRYMYNIEYEITTPNKVKLFGKGCKN
ncbi:FecR domain-containing protein [Chryseolinea sp. T2]|uniref:FecR family protein n=1 Tax=Chryseolinea sp. T2 TaxID=3129255 RepID=UPI0030773941